MRSAGEDWKFQIKVKAADKACPERSRRECPPHTIRCRRERTGRAEAAGGDWKFQIKVKSGGQECPPHTIRCRRERKIEDFKFAGNGP